LKLVSPSHLCNDRVSIMSLFWSEMLRPAVFKVIRPSLFKVSQGKLTRAIIG
jgi:hypothetical protein